MKRCAVRDESFKEFVLDQLRGLNGVVARGMFGGYGLYVPVDIVESAERLVAWGRDAAAGAR